MPPTPPPVSPELRLVAATVLALAVAVSTAQADVHLRTRTLTEADSIDASSLATATPLSELYVVTARGRIRPELRKQLALAGAEVLGYLPDDSYAVWAEPRALARMLTRADVWFASSIDPAARIAPELQALPDTPVWLEVTTVGQVPIDGIADALSELGLEVHARGTARNFHRIAARLPAGRSDLLAAAARLRGVYWIGARPRYRLLNDTSIWVGQAGLGGVGLTPVHDAGLRGEGQIAAVLDTGLDQDMCFFVDPAGDPPANTGFGTAVDSSLRKVIAYDFLWSADDPSNPGDYDDHSHGTHVAGSVLGDDLTTPSGGDSGDGMAPAAKLVVQDGGFEIDECADLPALGCPVVDLTPIFDQAFTQGARAHNNSWGDRENFTPQNTYTDGCVDVDEFMWTHPEFLIVFAAGNAGNSNDQVGSPATAKNNLAVGSTERGAGADTLSGFSSWGWAHDGRIAPTVTCPGSNIRSALSDLDINTGNCGQAAFSGTSMAAPTCTGFALLARQYFTDGYYPSRQARPADGFAPTAALVKATLINSGRDMRNEAPPISRAQGFGRVTLADTLAFPPSTHDLLAFDNPTAHTAAGQSWSYDVVVVGNTEPFKVTLVWTDPPSTPAAATNLINDLDLVVTGPDGTYLGNNLTGGFSTTGGTADRLNVEEQVHLAVPTAGTYTVEVRAEDIPQGPQGFSLVMRGDFPGAPGVGLGGISVVTDAIDPTCSDGDDVPDNGETVRLRVDVVNDSITAANNATASLATSSPYLTVVSVNPVALGTVAALGTVVAEFDLRIDGAPCRVQATVEVTVTSDENPSPVLEDVTFTLEQDVVPGSISLDFEGGLVDSNGESWDAAGGFGLSSGRANGGAQSVWAGIPPAADHCDGSGSGDGGNTCATLTSPPFTATGSTQLSLSTWYEIEGRSGGQWWDRANLHVVEGTVHSLLPVTGGRGYDGGNGDSTGLCHLSNEAGWAGDGSSWRNSTFDLSGWAGREIRVEVSYNTDSAEICEGIYVDDIQLDNVLVRGCDASVCAGCTASALTPLASLRGVLAGAAAQFEWLDPASGGSEFHLNSVEQPDLLGPLDPQSPRQAPIGQGLLECTTASLGCTDPDAITNARPILYYQALPACGPNGADEGPP